MVGWWTIASTQIGRDSERRILKLFFLSNFGWKDELEMSGK
jgi:hypothetical protein